MLVQKLEELPTALNNIQNQARLLLENKKPVLLEVKAHAPKRSLEQNAFYWMFMQELSRFLNDAGCSFIYEGHKLPYTPDILHEINKQLFGVKSTARMTVKEFCDHINNLLAFWQEKTNGEFNLPEPPETYLKMKGYQVL